MAKTQPTPPKIQTPPAGASVPTVKPPQPTGLMPVTAMPAGTATTQPLSVPRTGMTGLKPTRPVPPSSRSTQRIVLPTPPGSRPNSTKALAMGTSGGRINLPIGMILRCLPPEVLAEEVSKFEANGTAATEVGLPMNMILGQLPSGKVEIALQDLIAHFPAGYLQPTESIAGYLPNLINLPLMDVVMRIPPDLLALRPDQKDVDAAVINMADPFTEEILREQAETARQQSEPHIIEESQAPQEEFVPRDQAPVATPAVPPRRPAANPVIPTRAPAATTLAAPPMPAVAKLPTPTPTPSPMSSLRGSASPTPLASPPPPRNLSPSGQLPAPTRLTTSLPPRPQADPAPSPQSSAPVPPVPRHTGSIPAPPPPRHTTSLPVPRRTGTLPVTGQAAAAPVEKPAAPTRLPDANSDDLQRLAALAMAQLGDSNESPAEVPPKPEPVPAPQSKAEEPVAAIESPPAPVPIPASATPPVPTPEPPAFPVAVSQPPPQPVPQPAPEPEAPVQPASVAFNLNTCTAEDLVQNIPDCSEELAHAIVLHRTKIGSFKRIEELLDVPGITKAAYTNLTGETPPDNRTMLSLNELLGFPAGQHVSLKDVTDRISCWPDVTGCVLSQSSGLSLVGTVPESVSKAAIVAFAPRMFESINKAFSEVSGEETDALLIPSSGTSFHLFRNRDLYLIIMSRLPQMPERHVKVARFVLAALSTRKD
ncbi:MAG TPA: helix-hairpin-helix domain-containing protein [Candidatus Methylacidiphilales bacterium]|nr:helix-hairpin-helix domain-containing protein [Candidatus Methylacidiphilales bacterium]